MTWDFDMTFSAVSSELLTKWERAQAEEDDDEEAPLHQGFAFTESTDSALAEGNGAGETVKNATQRQQQQQQPVGTAV